MILVDAHVHIHDCFDIRYFLDSAYVNFKKQALLYGHGNNFTGVLLLTETKHNKWFSRLNSIAANDIRDSKKIGRWSFRKTEEECSIFVSSKSDSGFFIIAGSQIVTSEKLEILALGTASLFKNNQAISSLIDQINLSGGLAVIPWGFGKWKGRRGKILEDIIENTPESKFFLGDNSGRPGFTNKEPDFFKLAKSKGISILPGSDPLPFKSEYSKAGSYGFMIHDDISISTPANDLRLHLKSGKHQPEFYGTLESPLRFLKNQFSMQIRKHANN